MAEQLTLKVYKGQRLFFLLLFIFHVTNVKTSV